MSRKVLIYAGTGGIGSEIARLLQSHGDDVYLVGRHAESKQDLRANLTEFISLAPMSRRKVPSTRSWKRWAPSSGLVYVIFSFGWQLATAWR